MAELLAELNPKFYLIDPLPNMPPELVESNVERFVEILCGARDDTDIFKISDVPIVHSWLYPEMQAEFRRKNELFKNVFGRLHLKFPTLHYIDGGDFFGTDGEGTTDGIHPNDGGFMRMANILEQHLREFYEC